MLPAQELAGHLRREEPFLDQHLDDPHTEELFQGPGAHSRRDVEHAVVREQPVGHEGVKMGVMGEWHLDKVVFA